MFKDKNTIIGFSLLALLFFGYFYISSTQQKEAQMKAEIEQRKKDSIENAKNKSKYTAADTLKMKEDSVRNEQNKLITSAGQFGDKTKGTEQLTKVENDVFVVEFSNKGGVPKNIYLKKFNNAQKKPVQLLGDSADRFGYEIVSGNNQAINTSLLYFTTSGVTKNADGSSSIQFTLNDSSSSSIVHEYKIKPGSYLIDINIKGIQKLVTGGTANFTNNVMVLQQDNDKSYESQSAKFTLLKDGEYDEYNAAETRKFDVEKPVKWFGYKQRFFSSLLLANADLKNTKVEIDYQPSDSKKIYLGKTSTQIPVAANGDIALQYYAGPNDYSEFTKLGQQTKNIVTLHSQPFGFVKWINRGVVMPVFNWLLKNVGSVGLAIALLTLFIRLLIIPLTYSSYKSGAKMKALRPDLDKLKEKFKDDQQGYAVEQMKLFKQAGVSPLGGCLPALLQIPIFFALFALFTAHIGVRGESFLWAKDLSMYDDVIKFGFNIPLLGDHLSLFAITACITSFLISWYSMSMTPDQGNPVLKYMPYIFPVIMLFIFNNLPSALTWYYTVSNVVTLGIQYVIQNFIIDPNKIKAQIEENKKRVKPKSKFQERYEQMMEAQKNAKKK